MTEHEQSKDLKTYMVFKDANGKEDKRYPIRRTKDNRWWDIIRNDEGMYVLKFTTTDGILHEEKLGGLRWTLNIEGESSNEES